MEEEVNQDLDEEERRIRRGRVCVGVLAGVFQGCVRVCILCVCMSERGRKRCGCVRCERERVSECEGGRGPRSL